MMPPSPSPTTAEPSLLTLSSQPSSEESYYKVPPIDAPISPYDKVPPIEANTTSPPLIGTGTPIIGVIVGSATLMLAIITAVKLLIARSKVRNPGQYSSDSDSDDNDLEPLSGRSLLFPISMTSSSERLMLSWCDEHVDNQGRNSSTHSSFDRSSIKADRTSFPIPSLLPL
jgi:hypothetical protein